MRMPVVAGLIDRRILVNFRIDAEVLARVCPPPFRPQTVNGFGVGGICLIRLKHIRPIWLPSWFGIASENAAHRIAVTWESNGEARSGVYIPRRDTSSRLNAFAGGRVFPGTHHRAKFVVRETENDFQVEVDAVDGSVQVAFHGRVGAEFPASSVFPSLTACSDFFQQGSVGYSPRTDVRFESPPSSGSNRIPAPFAESARTCGREALPQVLDGLELWTRNWHMQPLEVSHLTSSFFENTSIFPPGSVSFDNALLMRNTDHEWHSREPLCCVDNGMSSPTVS